jgi:CheY-like chemotaxis protein
MNLSDTTMRVVIADDEPDVRAFYERILRMLGHDVVGVAENGILLVELSTLLVPDLIITDIQMPHMDGLEAVRIIVTVHGMEIGSAMNC